MLCGTKKNHLHSVLMNEKTWPNIWRINFYRDEESLKYFQ